MTRAGFLKNRSGTAAIEFAMLSSVFIALLVAIIGGCLAVWIEVGIQHGAEMAARCASVDQTNCGTTSAIQSYAAAQSYGIAPPPATFTVTTPTCGTKVSASYVLTSITKSLGIPSVTLTGSSCFPK